MRDCLLRPWYFYVLYVHGDCYHHHHHRRRSRRRRRYIRGH